MTLDDLVRLRELLIMAINDEYAGKNREAVKSALIEAKRITGGMMLRDYGQAGADAWRKQED